VPLPVDKAQTGAIALNYQGLIKIMREKDPGATAEEEQLVSQRTEEEDIEGMEEGDIAAVIPEEGTAIPRVAAFPNSGVCSSLL
jgi:hypothetical protein